MIIDSHCHLNYFAEDDIPKLIQDAEENDVKLLHTICTKIMEFKDLLRISELYNQVYTSVGIHPLNAADEYIKSEDLIKLTENKKVISIGETGLDFYKSNDKESQEKSFISHIEAAKITQLPIVIHSRDADSRMIDILRSEMKVGNFKGVLHCFSSSKELAYQAIDLGIYVSFSGIITFKNSDSLRKIVSSVPQEYVLVETDAPFLSPEPYRGKKNEPKMVKYVVDCIAKLWNKESSEIAKITTSNFLKLFSKVNFL
ncbi:TatD family hydrolase [Wolbachia endosymbiont of Pentidionis agamae]|uniref:TatD family hydrolase n=1 Tax=Wolbachia endosymbiont of Pentidionis agamae TaxID=3110435 RepID=UPI002FD6D346